MTKNDDQILGKKLVSYRIDTDVLEKFHEYLGKIKNKTGDNIAREGVIEFFMDYCVEIPQNEFLKMFYAYKTKKFSKT